MLMIDLNAKHWTKGLDFYDFILSAIGAPEWHGRNPNAIVDSMIWSPINTLQAPYTVRICQLRHFLLNCLIILNS